MLSSNKQSARTFNFKNTLLRAMEKSKATKDAAPTQHSGGSLAVDAADDSVDEYQPDDCEGEHDHKDAMMMDTPKTTYIGAHHTMALMDREAKQRHSDEQVGFIILTRDNNKPDAYGAVSQTYGPFPWPDVAKAYNEKYKLCVGAAAMEKRARQHRGAWMAKHPTYPIKITYAKKPKASQVGRSDVRAAEPLEHCVQSSARKERVVCAGEAHASNNRVGGWVPPDIIRNQTDLHRYLDQVPSAQMEVFDAQNVSLGAVIADCGDLLKSSAVFQRLTDGGSEAQAQLRCSAIAVVQSYVHCASSRGLAELPAHLLRDGSSLMNLYCFAAQLEDDWICELILALWHHFAESNAEVDLSLEDLNLLFESTRSGDPARNFWAATIYTTGLGARLVGMGECNVELIAEMQDVVARAV